MCSVILVDANILSDMMYLEGKEDNLDAKNLRWFRELRQSQTRLTRSRKLAQAKRIPTN